MAIKDQRLEIRISQETSDALDDISRSNDFPFRASRSEVARYYIEQGIARHTGRGLREDEVLPLATRLGLYFQLCLLERTTSNTSRPLYREKDRNKYTDPDFKESTATEDALVRNVYLGGFSWFFCLDKEHLESLNHTLTTGTVLSLMSPQPDPAVSETLRRVLELWKMYQDIEEVICNEENNVNYSGDDYRLRRLKDEAKENRVPLAFQGYPASEEGKTPAQMWAVLDWIEKGSGTTGISAATNSSHDYSAFYEILIRVYRDVRTNKSLDLDGLELMVRDRRFRHIFNR